MNYPKEEYWALNQVRSEGSGDDILLGSNEGKDDGFVDLEVMMEHHLEYMKVF